MNQIDLKMNNTILLIPHYNNFQGLLASLQSINAAEKIDVLIVDDGSVLRLDELMIKNAFKARGSISLEYLESNKGIEFALNHGLQFILERKYKYIARLDCGDLCLGKRFEIQEKFLNQNLEISIVGSNVLAVNLQGKLLYKIDLPLDDKNIKNKMFLNAMLIHPAILFSSSIIETVGLYPTKYKSAEDYAFFFAIAKKHKMANLPEYLTQIEINDKGISVQSRKQQIKSRIAIIKHNFFFGFYPIYGILRNYLLLFIPYSIILWMKKKLKNDR